MSTRSKLLIELPLKEMNTDNNNLSDQNISEKKNISGNEENLSTIKEVVDVKETYTTYSNGNEKNAFTPQYPIRKTEQENKSEEFWRIKKRKQWFCNRALPLENQSEGNLTSNVLENNTCIKNISSVPDFNVETTISCQRKESTEELEDYDPEEQDGWSFDDSDADPLYSPSDEKRTKRRNMKNIFLQKLLSEDFTFVTDFKKNSKTKKILTSSSSDSFSKETDDKDFPFTSKTFFAVETNSEDNLIMNQDIPNRMSLKNNSISRGNVKQNSSSNTNPSEGSSKISIGEQTKLNPEDGQSNIKKYIRKRDYCYFCETEVLNFARHVLRNHSLERDVQEILSKRPKSKERTELLANLRKKGNYIKNFGDCVKPVRQASLSNSTYLPCNKCLGFYSRKLLFRHRKRCVGNTTKVSAQAEGQNQLLRHIKIDEQLKNEVFPHMRADKVSLEAKSDTLICAYGARYLKTHRDKHFINVTSRKMRELAKIIIEIKKNEPTITNMFVALQPKYFDLFIEAAKKISGYNPQTDSYGAPTLAINIATSLKQCCDIAITFALKRKSYYETVPSAEAEASLKTMIHLFNSNWSFEVSTQAISNLNINKWNKVTMIPLASDLQLLKRYLIKVANDALRILNKDCDQKAYNALMESIYCRVILLNRKRPGELQRMLMNTYLNSGNNNQSYEEFNKAISPTEQILLKKLKRVVIKGKRGRGVPVLFSQDVQEHISKLLEIRTKFLPSENLYLFGRANLTTPISGYKVLDKYAKACGAKNPGAITSTRLRKHLATLSQVFSMTDSEIEQLATFMGHTLGIHKNSYRLPDDVYQTAKISKILLLMESGCSSQFKGLSLDEIDIDMNKDLLEDCRNISDDELETNNPSQHFNETEEYPQIDKTNKIGDTLLTHNDNIDNDVIRKRKRCLIPWTEDQKQIVRNYFSSHIRRRQAAKRQECEELISKHPDIFHNKNWLKIKVFVQNEYSKRK